MRCTRPFLTSPTLCAAVLSEISLETPRMIRRLDTLVELLGRECYNVNTRASQATVGELLVTVTGSCLRELVKGSTNSGCIVLTHRRVQ